uniref:DUF223 domain-containing protein n=1 Tax=Aegilops tauschii subsp. strangulata TaxID=200361 RepID=A0A452YMV8_AEGTS
NNSKGAKIEAIVAGKDLVNRFNITLHMGRKYIIHGVTCSFNARTFVESLSLQFPTYPKHLMPFQEVQRCPRNTFVGMHSSI